MILKTCILKFLGSGIKTIQQGPILNTMHVSGKGHLHNKRYGPYKKFGRVKKKSDIINFWDTILKFQVAAPSLYLQGHVSQNLYPKILGKWHKNNTAEPNTQQHARFWQGTPPQQKIWAIWAIWAIWDTILKFQVAAPCTFRAMFL